MKWTLMIMAATAVAGSLALAVPPTATQPSQAYEVQTLGISVSKGIPVQGYEHHWKSTSVTLLVRSKHDYLIGINQRHTEALELTDDKGGKLAVDQASILEDPPLTQPGEPEPTGLDLPIDIGVSGVPAKGANQIHLKASVALFCGSELKTLRCRVPLRPGSKLVFGKTTMEVTKVVAASDSSVDVFFAAKGAAEDLAAFKQIAFADTDSKSIEVISECGGGGNDYNEDNQEVFTQTWQYTLKRQAPEVIATVSYYTEVHTVQIPIDVQVGLGL